MLRGLEILDHFHKCSKFSEYLEALQRPEGAIKTIQSSSEECRAATLQGWTLGHVQAVFPHFIPLN